MTPENGKHIRDSFFQLLRSNSLSDSELKERLALATSKSYWEELCPDLSILRGCALTEQKTLTEEEISAQIRQFEEQGYFQISPLLDKSAPQQMGECVKTLRKNGWPGVFGFVYDEFYFATMTSSLRKILTSILGTDYKRTSHMWIYFVPASDGARGWPPHVDGKSNQKRVTIWIPLTDATLDNGCMYVIPQPLSSPELSDYFRVNGEISLESFQQLLQSSRALPAEAGSVLCWDYGIPHWGSVSRNAATPRISVGYSFIGNSTTRSRTEPPLFNGEDGIPSFQERLYLIGKSIHVYKGREPVMMRFLSLADSLIDAGTA